MLNGITRRWPSAPLVLSALALFVSLGGVGYAAATIGSGQIKNNSHINESKLGKVPNAGKADTATKPARPPARPRRRRRIPRQMPRTPSPQPTLPRSGERRSAACSRPASARAARWSDSP